MSLSHSYYEIVKTRFTNLYNEMQGRCEMCFRNVEDDYLVRYVMEVWYAEESLVVPDPMRVVKLVIEGRTKEAEGCLTSNSEIIIQKITNLWETVGWWNEQEINEMNLLECHRRVMKNLLNEGCGSYRTISVTSGFHVYPPHKYVPDRTRCLLVLLSRLMKETPQDNAFSYLFCLACTFFVEFLDIHPFVDGNGRVARLLFSNIMKDVNPIPLSLFCSDNTMYLPSLREHISKPPFHHLPHTAFAHYAIKCLIASYS